VIKRLKTIFPLDLVYIIEASLVLLFFTQAVRYLIGAIYANVSSASLYLTLDPNLIDRTMPGIITGDVANNQLITLACMLALPLVAFLLGWMRPLLVIAVLITAIGRYLMSANAVGLPDVMGASLAVGGGLLYLPLLARHRLRAFPYAVLLGFAVDQVYRAWGDTFDPSWRNDYLNIQIVLSAVVILLSLLTQFGHYQRNKKLASPKATSEQPDPDKGRITFWGGVGLGGLLFLHLSLLNLPNAIAGRSGTNLYTTLVPLVIVATLLPIIPAIRGQARRFISMFDSGARGWVWMLVAMLLIVIGLRLGGIISAGALVIAQFLMSMVWWWVAQPQAKKDRNFSGLWIIIGVIVFVTLTAFDMFTYEYAYVRDLAPELDVLNPFIPTLLRGFRGLGIAVILLGVFLATLPIVTTQKRIAWAMQSRWTVSFLSMLLIAGVSVLAVYFARPPVVRGVNQPETVRIGTYNIHNGTNEFSYQDLEMIARTIEFSGANVVLLQEVEIGRMTSYGVDQALWLARRLSMDVRFFPTNEGLQGLAVISNIPIVYDDGVLLTSVGNQTGMQRVQVLPDNNVITLYNVWFEPLLDTGNSQSLSDLEFAQNTQFAEAISTIASHFPDGRRGRMVIGGTFNNIPDSDIVRRMVALGFDDPFADQQAELSATYRRTGVQARLDYLWTTIANNFQVIESGVINDFSRQIIPHQPSDHLLAMVVVRLR
jgi:endonuclease/exonuclease/phosphatase family metal-dependent hydrolase